MHLLQAPLTLRPCASLARVPQEPRFGYKEWPVDFTKDGITVVHVRTTYLCPAELLSQPFSYFMGLASFEAYWTVDAADLATAAGAVALVEGISCPGMTWETESFMYWKLLSAFSDAGVVGVVYGEAWPGKIPGIILEACTSPQDGSPCLRVPVAHVGKADMDSALSAVGGLALQADFSSMRVYRSVDEPQLYPSQCAAAHSPIGSSLTGCWRPRPGPVLSHALGAGGGGCASTPPHPAYATPPGAPSPRPLASLAAPPEAGPQRGGGRRHRSKP